MKPLSSTFCVICQRSSDEIYQQRQYYLAVIPHNKWHMGFHVTMTRPQLSKFAYGNEYRLYKTVSALTLLVKLL